MITPLLDHYVFQLDDFLSHEECDRWITWSEEHGYDEALISLPIGQVRDTSIRNNERIIHDDIDYADSLWHRLKSHITEPLKRRSPFGLNERFRLYKYSPGQRFDWHFDGPVKKDAHTISKFTFLIYLNDDFEGGATSFSPDKTALSFAPFSVSPKKGAALLFAHRIQHRGDILAQGHKYVLRTDVMCNV